MRAPSASVTGCGAHKPPPLPDHIRLQRQFHKEVECQRRKIRENCDAFQLPPSIGGESADGESVPARVSLRRCQILWPEVSLDSSAHRLKKLPFQILREFHFSLPCQD